MADPLEVKDIFATICTGGIYTINGLNFNVAGDYFNIDTVLGTIGCDSIRNLHLFVSDFNLDTLNASICAGQQFVWNGQIFSNTGVYVLAVFPDVVERIVFDINYQCCLVVLADL